MISAFLVRPSVSGLFDIDRVFKVTQSRVKKWEVVSGRKTDFNSNGKIQIEFSAFQDFSIFDT